ncbi:hypothetical protein GCM10010530_18020 [Kribbella aluminosa]
MDALFFEEVEVVGFAIAIIVRASDQEGEAAVLGAHLCPPCDVREKGIADIEHDDPDAPASSVVQLPLNLVLDEPLFVHGVIDATRRVASHPRTIEYDGDGSHGHRFDLGDLGGLTDVRRRSAPEGRPGQRDRTASAAQTVVAL